MRSVVKTQLRETGRQVELREGRRFGSLLTVGSTVMCGTCGDVRPVDAAPSTRQEWEQVERAFHCVCEVR